MCVWKASLKVQEQLTRGYCVVQKLLLVFTWSKVLVIMLRYFCNFISMMPIFQYYLSNEYMYFNTHVHLFRFLSTNIFISLMLNY